ncbi:NuoI/complex I 23 kDa subunit family protein [Geoalkalibacter halelectricus]|uniref:NADH-quinone oxidoreductase subunit I n=1 Tax=Geoalkalibacter halelectricus TaxID=2847045 RepID=A0ABY5ZMG7_9BACT|nr:NADH-quinone oxidoreductase subunit I [Geoalkalibacter halelectricus]MDO3378639.1 NADH-quinone oxidoreductase subunit I [Geoalkalibacter halelectricus]UWZ80049.1 NADH-quinone oxidoreductase subunit I [Geoalkalibacter halelectricus]
MKAYFAEIFIGGKSLIVGMLITLREFFRPVVTVQYPRERLEISPNLRGHTILVRDEEKPQKHRCISCKMCERECPSNCISLQGEKREGVKGLVLVHYQLDFTKCSLCGTCVEVCPTDALDYSNEYRHVGFTREEFNYDLLRMVEKDQ